MNIENQTHKCALPCRYNGVPMTTEDYERIGEEDEQIYDPTLMAIKLSGVPYLDIKELSQKISQRDFCHKVIDSVCMVMGANVDEITNRSRKRKQVQTRMLSAYYMTKYIPINKTKHKCVNMGLQEMALLLGLVVNNGNGDHGTIVYYRKVINGWLGIKDQRALGWIEKIDNELLKRLQK